MIESVQIFLNDVENIFISVTLTFYQGCSSDLTELMWWKYDESWEQTLKINKTDIWPAREI